MLRKQVIFTGSKLNEGNPEQRHVYLIIAANQIGGNHRMASVYPVTNSPMPNPSQFLAANDDNALNDAIASLRAIPEIKGLGEEVIECPDTPQLHQALAKLKDRP